mgnify:CR=1 FL=1|jgi:hypothetical protein|tara:strand:- start:6341 stop:6748 length:408 start_codon:yes stop_codon:yes gene_type:complete
MRDIRVSKLEFNEFIFPFVTNSQAESDAEREVAIRVLRILRDPDITVEETVSDAVREQAAKLDKHIWAGRKLLDDSHTFTFEEDEYQVVKKRLIDAIPSVNIIALEHFSPLIDKFKDAEKYVVKVEKDEPEEDVA